MNILVTGANGFVGQAVVGRLKSAGINVIAVSRSKDWSSKTLARRLVIGAVDGQSNWEAALEGVDVVIHLAARVHVMQDSAADPLAEFRDVNLHGAINLARQARDAGVRRFVYVSSIKVNGEYTNPNQPFQESDEPKPQDPYALSKWEAEKALHAISRDTGMEIVIIRPPLVYGPGVKANFAQLLRLVDSRIPLPLGAVRNSRSLVYVGNLADALVTCATHPKAAGNTYLVSDGEDVSTPQLIQAVTIALDKTAPLIPLPIPILRLVAKALGKAPAIERLTQSLVIDCSKIRSELNWVPPYTMAEGLKLTAEWYRTAQA